MCCVSRDRQAAEAARRISVWGTMYLDSTRESIRRANSFLEQDDPFTGYLYLFVAFNNLYSLLAQFAGKETVKIRHALAKLPGDAISLFYTSDYVELVNDLNDSFPEQTLSEPDGAGVGRGIIDMKAFFLGHDLDTCIKHAMNIAAVDASPEEKLGTIQDVAEELLFTVRNNQFHAIKGPHRLADQRTLLVAFRLLRPMVDALLELAQEKCATLRVQPNADSE